MAKPDLSTPEGRALSRARSLSALVWHTTAYVLVNGFLWVLDLVTGGGIEWAYWTTIPWGLGLVFHFAAYMWEDRGFERRKYEQYLAEERMRETASH